MNENTRKIKQVLPGQWVVSVSVSYEVWWDLEFRGCGLSLTGIRGFGAGELQHAVNTGVYNSHTRSHLT